jgi:AraC-like DNA-binding protein
MLDHYEALGWRRTGTTYGFRLEPPPTEATGSMEIWGDPATHAFIDSDVVFRRELVERFYYRERGVQMSFVDEMNARYYQTKNEANSARPGMYVYVNNLPRPWFKRFPAGYRQRVCTILVMESFFATVGLSYSDEEWDRAAVSINNNAVPFPEVALRCKQLRRLDLPRSDFPEQLRRTVTGAVRHVFEHALTQRPDGAPRLTAKSMLSARRAIEILNAEYSYPPDIETLAEKVGVDKKTLQKAFKRIAGRTVGEFLRTVRMERALALLEDGAVPIEEVSRSVGYLSKVNFYKSFRRVFACSPHDVRVAVSRRRPARAS